MHWPDAWQSGTEKEPDTSVTIRQTWCAHSHPALIFYGRLTGSASGVVADRNQKTASSLKQVSAYLVRRACQTVLRLGALTIKALTTGQKKFRHGPQNAARSGRSDVQAPARGREAMEEMVDAGLATHLGVSNFSVAQLEALLEHARVPPVANQVELHPLLAQRKLVGVCLRKVRPQVPVTMPPLQMRSIALHCCC